MNLTVWEKSINHLLFFKVVSETMNNYLMFNKIMKFELLPKVIINKKYYIVIDFDPLFDHP